MAYIVLSIIGIIAVLIIKSNWQQKKQWAIIVAALITGLVTYIIVDVTLLSKVNVIQKGPSAVIAQIPWIEISLYFVMLAGMAAKYLYDAIGEGNKIQFQKWQFIKPILVSPIIFGIVYSTLAKETGTILLIIFSFQNGFFWQTVLYKAQSKINVT